MLLRFEVRALTSEGGGEGQGVEVGKLRCGR